MFITFEGIEGCGKSTQVSLLFDFLEKEGISCIKTKEPGGGGKFSMDIRNILATSDSLLLSELFAIYAARNEHLKKVIEPSISEGKVVICDRFIDSSIAYFCYNSKNEYEYEKKLNIINQFNEIVEIKIPDITFFIDTDVEIALSRVKNRSSTIRDKYDSAPIENHLKIQSVFRELAEKFPDRIVRIDGNLSPEEIFDQLKPNLLLKGVISSIDF